MTDVTDVPEIPFSEKFLMNRNGEEKWKNLSHLSSPLCGGRVVTCGS
jgi:hypothetical protein